MPVHATDQLSALKARFPDPYATQTPEGAEGWEARSDYGQPQDVEWAMDRHADGTSRVMLLQARPETNWKKRKEEQNARKNDKSAASALLGFISAASKGS